ncbi:MAG: tagatose 1,6-diphosphate aldolase [Chloroflexota bacterium]
MLTPGKIRGLSTLASPQGTFKILAADHRDSMRVIINPADPDSVPAQTLTDIKMSLLREVAPYATAVMLDPVYSAAQALVTRSLPGRVGFLCAVEAQGYAGEATARETTLLNGWSVEKAKRIGASAIKLLVYYHPEAGAATEAQEETIRGVIADCARYDIPLFLEPLYYSPDPAVRVNSDAFAAQRRQIVTETVRRLGALCPDVLKIQFPLDVSRETDPAVWADACAELDDTSPVPWAILSGGDPFESFKQQVEAACKAGCSGFMAGRALWTEVIDAEPAQRDEIARIVALPRLQELAAIVDEHGHDWLRKHDVPDVDAKYYQTY